MNTGAAFRPCFVRTGIRAVWRNITVVALDMETNAVKDSCIINQRLSGRDVNESAGSAVWNEKRWASIVSSWYIIHPTLIAIEMRTVMHTWFHRKASLLQWSMINLTLIVIKSSQSNYRNITGKPGERSESCVTDSDPIYEANGQFIWFLWNALYLER